MDKEAHMLRMLCPDGGGDSHIVKLLHFLISSGHGSMMPDKPMLCLELVSGNYSNHRH